MKRLIIIALLAATLAGCENPNITVHAEPGFIEVTNTALETLTVVKFVHRTQWGQRECVVRPPRPMVVPPGETRRIDHQCYDAWVSVELDTSRGDFTVYYEER